MFLDVEAVISELQELLPNVARESTFYRNPTELVKKSRELGLAAKAIDETLPDPNLATLAKGPFISVSIGSRAVEALVTRNLSDGTLETSYEMVNPGERYDLLYKLEVSTDVFDPSHREPFYGHMRYFDLATLGRILEDGGELSPSERAS